MYTFVTVLILIACVLVVLVVLIQNSKGGGLASGFSASTQVMGVRKTADFLEKLTWGLAIGIMVLSLLANFALPQKGGKEKNSALQEKLENYTPPADIPANNNFPPQK